MSCALGRGSVPGRSAAVCYQVKVSVMPVFLGNVPRRSRKATGLALEVMLADAAITASRPGCMPNYIGPAPLDCLTFAGCHARPASRSKLRFPSPRWTALSAPQGRRAVGRARHANVASSRRWPAALASPSYFHRPSRRETRRRYSGAFKACSCTEGRSTTCAICSMRR